jgi:hypothetical protein
VSIEGFRTQLMAVDSCRRDTRRFSVFRWNEITKTTVGKLSASGRFIFVTAGELSLT